MEARQELHYLQHGHVNHRALQINGSNVDVFTINLVHHLRGVKRHNSYCKLCCLFDGNFL